MFKQILSVLVLVGAIVLSGCTASDASDKQTDSPQLDPDVIGVTIPTEYTFEDTHTRSSKTTGWRFKSSPNGCDSST